MPLFPLPFADANSILDRMKATLLKPLSVEFSVSRIGSTGKAIGTLAIQRPHRMRYTVKLANEDYESVSTEDGTVDLSRTQRIYMETLPLDRLYQPASHYSELPDVAFPLILLAADPRELLADAGKAELAGTLKIGNVTCDHIKTSGYDAWIAPDGRLMRFRRKGTTFDFTNYKIAASLPRSTFELPIPVGYKPFVLPRETISLQAGAFFPTMDWVTMAGAPSSPETGKPFLAVVGTSECIVSGRAKNALSSLKSDVAIWVFSDSKVPAGLEGFSALRDKGNRTMDRLFVPVTPFFFLVGKDGRVKKLWMGFDPKTEDQFIAEVRKELSKS